MSVDFLPTGGRGREVGRGDVGGEVGWERVWWRGDAGGRGETAAEVVLGRDELVARRFIGGWLELEVKEVSEWAEVMLGGGRVGERGTSEELAREGDMGDVAM